MRLLLRTFPLLALSVFGLLTPLATTPAQAQTNPTPQSIPYSQDFGTPSFSVMPNGTAAWRFNGTTASSQAAAEASAPSADAVVTALTATTTTGGSYGYSTSSNARYYVQTSSNTTSGANQLVMAINSTGTSNVKVGYDVEMISATARTVGVVMQYRVGTAGAWTTVAGAGNPFSQAGGTTGVKVSPRLTLPAAADNQPVVQVRWALWRGTEAGSSSGLAIDNISVTAGTGGNGSGSGAATPTSVFTNAAVPSVAIAVTQDQAFTLTDLSVTVPAGWTWSQNAADVALSGAAFAGAAKSVVGNDILISGAAVTQADGGTVTISSLTAPGSAGTSTFTLKTAESGGTLTAVVTQPSILVLQLTPIVDLHVNDSQGVAAAPYTVSTFVTVEGTVTTNWSAVNTDIYIQDATGGVDLFKSAALPPVPINVGDNIIVSGSITQFRGLIEITPDFNLLQVVSTGNPLPEPLVLTCADVNATFQPDFTEPNEGRLVRVNGITAYTPGSGGSAGQMTDATGTTNIFVTAGYTVPSQFDVIGILKQFKPGTGVGPPFTGDYEVSPRTQADIINQPGPIILSNPIEDDLQATSVRLNWTTDVPSSSIVNYGTTTPDNNVVDPTLVTNHSFTVTGLTPATIYTYNVGSEDVNGSNFSSNFLFSTASPPATTGVMNVYFNHSIDPTLAWKHTANGPVNLTSLLVNRINAAQTSIDVALYSLSGTPGSTIATALINAKNRGVTVRMIGEADNFPTTAYTNIGNAGIPQILDTFDATNGGNGLMHNKFFVIDAGSPDGSWVWMGSWNPTDPGTNDDYQNSVEIQDQALAVTYTREFNEMWGSDTSAPNAVASRFGADKKNNTPHKFKIGGVDVESYFSPSDRVTSHIVSTINAASHSIGFELLTMTRTDISGALISQKTAGLNVRGDMDNNTDSGTQYNVLVGSNVDVKLKTGSGLLHHKYMITDAEDPSWGGTTLTGSHNWSASAENSNNENTLIIHDSDITNQFLQEFVARYHQFGGLDDITLLAVDPITGVTPGRVFLAQNSPNPAMGRTGISYAIPAKSKVSLKLFDVTGREVRTLVDQVQMAGSYRVDFGGAGLKSGMYFYRLQAGNQSMQRKMIFMN